MSGQQLEKHRLYVDEVGNSDLGASENPNHRYLSLTGVAISLSHVRDVLHPSLESLKQRFFHSHPDEPVILHRKELVNKRHPFEALRDPRVETAFNSELLQLLRELEYMVITVVIDKLEHKRKYTVWQIDPYHYCLRVLVERFVRWLDERNAVGDVMAESRGGKEDRRLKDSFVRVVREGTGPVPAELISQRLTSCQLKVESKRSNIVGLQLADMIAHPSQRATMARHFKEELPQNFGGRIAEILEDRKYRCSPGGKIEGWGRKWLP